MKKHSRNLLTSLFIGAIFLALVIGCRVGGDSRSSSSDGGGNPFGGQGSSTGEGKSKSGAPSSKNSSKPTLIGRWQSSEATVEFINDRSLTINNVRYNYSVSGSTLTLIGSDGQVDMPYTLNGNTLTVTFEGRKVVYNRVSGGSSDGGDTADNPPSQRGGGSNPPELAGKWCYASTFNAVNGGGSQADTCFILNPDGTYVYHSERSSSNPYGGTSSQSDDNGRWSATATTLTAQSSSGETKTYTLEKRNHPKNGDPMLIVDGDAYISYYQKPSW